MRLLTVLMLAGPALALAAGPEKTLTPEECYAEVSTAAEILQVCLVNQSHDAECQLDQQALDAQMKACLKAGGTAERVELARQIGASQIEGDPAQSVYQLTVARQREATRLLRVNEDRFRTRFAKLLAYAPQLFEQTFDTRACPLAFEGNGQNYLMSGMTTVKRQGEQALPQLIVAEEEQTHAYFARMARGKCYRPDKTVLAPDTRVEPDQPHHVYNFPQSLIAQLPEETRPILIDELRKGAPEDKPFRIGTPLTVKVRHYPTPLQGKVHRHLCDTALSCLKQRARLIDDYSAYNKALQEKNQATACLVYLDPNRRGEISIDQLYGMECNDASGKRLLSESSRKVTELGNRLFR